MDANAILEKIVQEGAEQAQKILEEAGKKAEELKKASEDKIGKQLADIKAKSKQDGEQLRDRMLRMAELEWKKDSLSAKREVLDKAFAGALAELEKTAPDKLREIFLALAVQTAQGDEEVLIGDKNAAWYSDSFIADVNALLVKNGKCGELKKGVQSIPGVGFALNKDGMQINCTMDALLNQERLNLEIEVSRILFN